MKKKRQSFFKGAAILAFAGIAVKVIGACYKIPLGNLIGPVGMADFSVAYSIYALLFTLSTAGVPSAVSKLVSEALARKNEGYAGHIYKVSYLTFAVIGFAGFSVMFFGADIAAGMMGSKSAALSIRAVSPAVMFVSLSAVNRGYFQGQSNMYPTAVSEIIEALGKLVCGISAALLFKLYGFGDSAVSAGAIAGVSLGAFFSAIYFAFCRDGLKERCRREDFSEKKTISCLMRLAIPITAGASVMSLGNVIDSGLVMNLLSLGGFSEYRSKWLFGAYNYAVTLFNMPSVLTTTLAVAAIPAIASSVAGNNLEKASKLANSAVKIAMAVAVPAAFGLYAMAYEATELIYGGGVGTLCAEASGMLLRYLCPAIPLLAVVTVTNSIHQALGKAKIPVFSMLAGVTAKIISNILLVGNAQVNILGAPISTVLCYGVIAAINIASIRKYRFIKLKASDIIFKPLILGAVAFFFGTVIKSLTRSLFGFVFSTVFASFVGFAACVVTAFLIGVVDTKQKKRIFHQKSISKFLNND